MRLSQIKIDQFGVWRDLELPIANQGLSVVYGPNEAGKTTLLRFIRSVLYGRRHEVDPRGRRVEEPAWSGSLQVDHSGNPYVIQRAADGGGRGTASVTSTREDAPNAPKLGEFLGGTDEAVFENVFALGLQELQELATLQDDQVAQVVYGMTLGPEGQRLLGIRGDAEERRRALLSLSPRSGKLVSLLRARANVRTKTQSAEELLERHGALTGQRAKADSEIGDMKARQKGIAEQLRGHLFLERVHKPWSEIREAEAHLKKLPIIVGFPEDGLTRLDEVERQIDSNLKCRTALLAESHDKRKAANQLDIDADARRHIPTIRSLIDDRERIAQLEGLIASAAARGSEEKSALDAGLQELGREWTVDRLKRVDASPTGYVTLVKAADSYRGATGQRARLRRRYRRLLNANRQEQSRIESELKKARAGTPAEAIEATRTKLARLEEVGTLRSRASDLEYRGASATEQLESSKTRLSLPPWVNALLLFFAVAGVISACLGYYAGAHNNALAGAMWATLGVTTILIAWGFRDHFENALGENVKRLREDSRRHEQELRQTRASIAQLAGPNANDTTNVELIRRTTRRLAELERLAEADERVKADRRTLAELRVRLQGSQRDFSAARGEWCSSLKKLGLSESLQVDPVLETMQRVMVTDDRRRRWEAATTEHGGTRNQLEAIRQRVERLRKRLPHWSENANGNLTETLAAWERALNTYTQNRAERKRLRSEAHARKREAAEYSKKIRELRRQRSALLVRGGATNRDEFEKRCDLAGRRVELEEVLLQAREDLALAAKTEPQLAMVEEDLLSYVPEENAECIQVLNLELEELDRDLRDAYEKLGGFKQALRDLESDTQHSRLQYEEAELAARVRQAAEEWIALEISERAVDRVRSRFERNSQPAMLAAASKYLEQLTRGRYKNVWTPLGERHLCVDDDRNRSFRVEDLSNGTREQLFLAVRLAVVHDFASRGIELPMVLDDILVNFDQLRTEAAVETLLRFAGDGQQILFFTCHLHLAHMLENRGIEPIWLPGHQHAAEERRAG